MLYFNRAILRCSKLVLLDEATSVVDPQTDKLIQETIKEDLCDCTILTVAHRIHTIINSDRILVIDNGVVESFDTPEVVFAQENGTFRRMCIESGISLIGEKTVEKLEAANF
ncbi:ABC transporter transmembrane region domain-containing protein [Cardiosporidium cionae]|uniref:ABC transporter transmembrane region domain-containing protein n=1 Tax=Cardiosporidium cionae TaxID=476202 RepID=A0ABQ7J6B0_9APIC|nr:ABC transporter transmembrane region domain-containing protein [Cardiosporidium cionae]|eukprot:KAF8819537.1 ABC transporter transmembrane region domain-containing protein [Cardiosporidium cionae]